LQVVLVPEQRRDFVVVAGENSLGEANVFFEILDDVVALDVDPRVMHQHRHQGRAD